MSQLRLGDDGFLPLGLHRCDLAAVHALLVRPEVGDVVLRQAVFNAVAAWTSLARRRLGPGRTWLSGGFVASGEPDDLALVTFWPEEEQVLRRALGSGAGASLMTISEVVYADPHPGGTMAERWPVSELVDAVFVERLFEDQLRDLFSRTLTEQVGVPSRTKGFVEVVCT